MKQMKKFIIPVILLISFQGLLGQNIKKEIQKAETQIQKAEAQIQQAEAQIQKAEVFEIMANSEFDFIIRINRDMNDEELNSRIDVLHRFDKDIEIQYTRDKSGNIKTFSSSGSKASCMSDNFDFIIIALKDNHWNGCMISDKT
jgi:hypothetical protein